MQQNQLYLYLYLHFYLYLAYSILSSFKLKMCQMSLGPSRLQSPPFLDPRTAMVRRSNSPLLPLAAVTWPTFSKGMWGRTAENVGARLVQNGCFCKLGGVLFVGVLITRALLFGV